MLINDVYGNPFQFAFTMWGVSLHRGFQHHPGSKRRLYGQSGQGGECWVKVWPVFEICGYFFFGLLVVKIDIHVGILVFLFQWFFDSDGEFKIR